jgi:hypothetical protein
LNARRFSIIVPRLSASVCKTPAIIAYDDLMERILDRGVMLDGESQLAAMGAVGQARLSARTNAVTLSLTAGSGINGVNQRRRGAPQSRTHR